MGFSDPRLSVFSASSAFHSSAITDGAEKSDKRGYENACFGLSDSAFIRSDPRHPRSILIGSQDNYVPTQKCFNLKGTLATARVSALNSLPTTRSFRELVLPH